LEYFEGDPEKAARFAAISGLAARRIASEGVTASDLCLQAAQRLLAATGTDVREIGALFFVSLTPDYLLPASAAVLQHSLGLPQDCAVMDMNVGCAGFVNGMWLAAGLLQSRACSKILLLVGDTPARFTDPANRVTGPVFGDAGTASLLEYRKDAGTMSFSPGVSGERYEALIIPGGGSRIPPLPEESPAAPFNRVIPDGQGNPWTLGAYGRIWMEGMLIYSFGVSTIPPHIKAHLEKAGLGAGDLDYLMLHQANKLMVGTIAKKVGVSAAKAPWGSLAKYGNLGAASLPSLICDTLVGKEDGGRDNIMLCGYGAGLTWNSCLLSLRDAHILPASDYVPPEHITTRAERIQHWHARFAGETEQE
jgi:3-oxoacyl-[acyl-carrier-protein] synthase-3